MFPLPIIPLQKKKQKKTKNKNPPTCFNSVTCGRSGVFFSKKIDSHDITEILLKVVSNTITPIKKECKQQTKLSHGLNLTKA